MKIILSRKGFDSSEISSVMSLLTGNRAGNVRIDLILALSGKQAPGMC